MIAAGKNASGAGGRYPSDEHGQNCSRNEATYADHIWGHHDAEGRMSATACVIVPWFVDL